MADDRRLLLRRQLLKEQLIQESEAPQVVQQAQQHQMSREDIDAKDAEFQKQQSESDLAKAIPALGAGAAQGLTFGLSDELGGATDVLTKDSKPNESMYDKYRRYQQLRQKSNEEAEEQSPIAYNVGEIGAGVLGGLAMPALGTEELVTRGAIKALGKNAVTKAIAEKSASTAANVLGAGTKTAIEGAPLGAAYGLGMSKNTIDNPEALASDVAGGAATGSIAGMALGSLGQGISATKQGLQNYKNDSPFIRQTATAYNLGKEGTNLAKGSVKTEMAGSASKDAGELVSKIKEADSFLGQKVGDALRNAQDQGISIDITQPLTDISGQIEDYISKNPSIPLDPRTKKTLSSIVNREITDLTPTGAKAVKDQMNDLIDSLEGSNSEVANTARRYAYQLNNAIDSSLKENIPEYAKASQQFAEFRSKIPETILNPGVPEEYNAKMYGSMKNKEQNLFNSSKNLIEQSQTPGTAHKDYLETFGRLKQNLQDLQESNPEAVKKMGGSADEIINNLQDVSDKQSMLKAAYGHNPQESLGGQLTGQALGFSTTGPGQVMSVANKIGMAAGSAPARGAQAMFRAPEDMLMGLAGKLKADPASAQLGQALETAVQNKNEAAKNAALFSILQNPNLRMKLRDSGDLEQEGQK